MAEINTGNGQGKGKKTRQKKADIRVDFTPMVDMNMLLITFFMFCTSLIKPQTMEINMPSRDEVKVEERDKVRASEAVTIILGGDDRVFYYLGLFEAESYDDPNFLRETDYSESGLRAMLLARNRAVTAQINELKAKRLAEQITEEEFQKQSIEIKVQRGAPRVMIKTMDESIYRNLIDVLDEMLITNIGVYAIVDLQDGEKYLVDKYLGLSPEVEN